MNNFAVSTVTANGLAQLGTRASAGAKMARSLQWHHNGRDGVSNHQHYNFFIQPFIHAQIKKNIKAPRRWPMCGEFTGDRGISRTNGQ